MKNEIEMNDRTFIAKVGNPATTGNPVAYLASAAQQKEHAAYVAQLNQQQEQLRKMLFG